MQHSPVKRSAISKCSRCGGTEYTKHLIFKQNISYFFERNERQFSGYFCFSCASTTFVNVELTTLFGTWWAIAGAGSRPDRPRGGGHRGDRGQQPGSGRKITDHDNPDRVHERRRSRARRSRQQLQPTRRKCHRRELV